MHIKIEGVNCINLQVNFNLKLRTLKVHNMHTWMIEWRAITWFNNADCEVFRVEDEDLNMMDYDDVGKWFQDVSNCFQTYNYAFRRLAGR